MAEKTYTVSHGKGEDKKQEHFESGRAAAEAFHKVPAEREPSVIRIAERGETAIIASTIERRQGGDQAFSKVVNFDRDPDFRDGWERAELEQRRRSYDRDRESGIQSGMMRIDGQAAAELHALKYKDAGETRYDVEFYAKRDQPGPAIARLHGIDRIDLENAIGEKNARQVVEHKEPSLRLAGDKLAYDIGYSPAEVERQVLAKEERKSREMEQMRHDGPSGTEKGRVIELVSFKHDGASHMAARAEEGKSYQGRVIAVTDQHIIQRHVDEKSGKETNIAHDKTAVSNFARESVGKEVEIAYPHGKAGLAREVKEAAKPAGEHQHGRVEPGKDRDR